MSRLRFASVGGEGAAGSGRPGSAAEAMMDKSNPWPVPPQRARGNSSALGPSRPLAAPAATVKNDVGVARASSRGGNSSAYPPLQPVDPNLFRNELLKLRMCKKWRAGVRCNDDNCRDAHDREELEPGMETELDKDVKHEIKENGRLCGLLCVLEEENTETPSDMEQLLYFVHGADEKHRVSIEEDGLWTAPASDGQTDRELVLEEAPKVVSGVLVESQDELPCLKSLGALDSSLLCWAQVGSGPRALDLLQDHVFYVSATETDRNLDSPLILTLLFVPEDDQESLRFARMHFEPIEFPRGPGTLLGRKTLNVGGIQRRVTYAIARTKSVERGLLELETTSAASSRPRL